MTVATILIEITKLEKENDGASRRHSLFRALLLSNIVRYPRQAVKKHTLEVSGV